MKFSPSILLAAKPSTPTTACEVEAECLGDASPYLQLIHSMQAFMWVIRELEAIIDTGRYFPFILIILIVIVSLRSFQHSLSYHE